MVGAVVVSEVESVFGLTQVGCVGGESGPTKVQLSKRWHASCEKSTPIWHLANDSPAREQPVSRVSARIAAWGSWQGWDSL